MKKNSIPVSEIPELTIGLDLSDHSFQFCELNAKGEIVNEGQLKLDRATLRKYLAAQAKARAALETGGQSRAHKRGQPELTPFPILEKEAERSDPFSEIC